MDDVTERLAFYRDREFASLVLVVIGLVAETHPEELRAALGRAFDLAAVEEQHRRVAALLAGTQALAANQAAEVRHLVEAVHKDIDKIEGRIDALREYLDRLKPAATNGRK